MNPNPSSHTFGSSAFVQTRDGRKLHYMSRGTGELTVVFESGMGASRSNWGLVAPAIVEHARAVVYDRAGAGRSDVDSAPRSLERIAGDLGELLTALGGAHSFWLDIAGEVRLYGLRQLHIYLDYVALSW